MSQTKAQLISDLVQALNFTGTSSAPANGMYLSAANTISLGINSAELLTVNGTRILTKSPSGTDTTVRFQHTGNSGYGDIILDRTVNAFIIDNDPSNASNNQSYFSVKNKGAVNFYIKHDGKIGIGTTSPDTLLHVESSGATSTRISGNRGDSNNLHIANIEFENTFNTQGVVAEIRAITGGSGTQSSKGQLAFYTDDGSSYAERLRIDSGGRVGIGVTPSASEGTELAIKSSDGATNIALVPNANTEFSQISFYNAALDSTQGYIKYNNNDNSLQFRVNLGTALHINNSKNVGIGTTSPEDLLHIKTGKIRIENAIVSNNDSTISYDDSDFLIDIDPNNVRGSSKFQIKVDTVAGLTIDDNRRVGIGTTSPVSKLHVANDNSFAAKFGGTGGGSDYFIEIGQLANNGSAGFNATGTSGSMLFKVAGNEYMRIAHTTGNVGIGTSSPGNKLHVAGITQIENGGSGSQGDAQLFIRKGSSTAAPESITRANSYLHLGGTEWGNNAAGVYTLSFGYTNGTTGTNVPAYIGFKETTTSSYTKGDLVFGLKSSNSDTAPTEALRITSTGKIHSPNAVQSGGNSTSGFQFDAVDTSCVLGIQGKSAANGGSANNAVLQGWFGSSNTFRLNCDGLIKTSKGVDFSGAQSNAAGMTSETLDSYEEGTWTIGNVSGLGGTNVSVNTARYTKIGDIVHITFNIFSNDSNMSTGGVTLTGLPFQVQDHQGIFVGGYNNKDCSGVYINSSEQIVIMSGNTGVRHLWTSFSYHIP
jgi:hypothetical protein